jgi:hypothetical protein
MHREQKKETITFENDGSWEKCPQKGILTF